MTSLLFVEIDGLSFDGISYLIVPEPTLPSGDKYCVCSLLAVYRFHPHGASDTLRQMCADAPGSCLQFEAFVSSSSLCCLIAIMSLHGQDAVAMYTVRRKASSPLLDKLSVFATPPYL